MPTWLSTSPTAASGNGHCGAADSTNFCPPLLVLVPALALSRCVRRAAVKGTRLAVVDSKSRSKPLIVARPKGRRIVVDVVLVVRVVVVRLVYLLVLFIDAVAMVDGGGPNMAQRVSAHVVASLGEAKPPSV